MEEKIETQDWEKEKATMLNQGYSLITEDDKTYWIK